MKLECVLYVFQGRVSVPDILGLSSSEALSSKTEGEGTGSLIRITEHLVVNYNEMIISWLAIDVISPMLISVVAGSLKTWESSIDLVNILKHEIRDGQLSFRGKRILEVFLYNLLISHSIKFFSFEDLAIFAWFSLLLLWRRTRYCMDN